MNNINSNSEMIQKFKDDGYLVYNEIFDSDELKEIKDHVELYIDEVAPKMPENQVYYDQKNQKESLKQIQKMFEYNTFFNNLIHGRIYELAGKLLGENPKVINLQYFNKSPKYSKPTPPHQDGFYFKIKPIKAITFWLALDDVNETNGAIQYYLGSHKQGLKDHQNSGILGFSQRIPEEDVSLKECKKITLICKAGTLLAHDALMIHSADSNRSSHSRKSLGFIYYGTSVEIDEQSANDYQVALDKELLSKGLVYQNTMSKILTFFLLIKVHFFKINLLLLLNYLQ